MKTGFFQIKLKEEVLSIKRMYFSREITTLKSLIEKGKSFLFFIITN